MVGVMQGLWNGLWSTHWAILLGTDGLNESVTKWESESSVLSSASMTLDGWSSKAVLKLSSWSSCSSSGSLIAEMSSVQVERLNCPKVSKMWLICVDSSLWECLQSVLLVAFKLTTVESKDKSKIGGGSATLLGLDFLVLRTVTNGGKSVFSKRLLSLEAVWGRAGVAKTSSRFWWYLLASLVNGILTDRTTDQEWSRSLPKCQVQCLNPGRQKIGNNC